MDQEDLEFIISIIIIDIGVIVCTWLKNAVLLLYETTILSLSLSTLIVQCITINCLRKLTLTVIKPS